MFLNHMKNIPLAKGINRDLAPELFLDSTTNALEFAAYNSLLLVEFCFVPQQLECRQYASPGKYK